ncbi:ribonuclease H-like domain-containing protein [Tanacetum coccineum]|uniref:Ribonuclease H-like domain-containing protein n=1 Tax=Tanacetum coccineum TaxID=301880 RepID=A0ABQ4WH01_9ASTR
MITQSQSGIVKPIDNLSLHTSSISHIPKNPSHALKDPNWRNVMYDEYNVLVKYGTWLLVPRPAGVNMVRSMWLFKHKFHADGTLSRYKARLVANGSSQQLGVDFNETFSLPPGFVDNRYPHHVCLLQRSLYGLKQAPRAWFQRFAASCLTLLQQNTGSLNNEFDMTDLVTLNYFLGISANRTPTGLFLSQKKYALHLLERAYMVTCNPSRTPVDTKSKLGPEGAPIQDPTLYRSLAGGLQYLTFTRPDLSYAVQQIYLYMHDPREPHLAALKRILRYVQEDMEFESAQSNTTAKPPILKLAQENGIYVTKMSIPVTAKEKTNKKNDVKARSLLLMALPNEHQLTFSQYNDAKTMFVAIETRFGESLDSIFNRLQKIVSRLAILGVVITQEDLNSKFMRSLPLEWNTHVVVWINKAEIETISIDDLYNNFKIVEQSVKKSVCASSGAQNLAFMTAPSTSSTNNVNNAKLAYEVSTVTPNVNTTSPQVSVASFNDNVVYAFMVKNPNGSNLLQQDLEQIHDDDLEAMDLKWQLSLISMRAKRYFQRTGKKTFINANDTSGYDKSKVECFNCHKIGHFARECRAPRNKEGQIKYQDNTRKHGNNEDTSSKEMLAIDGVGFDWSDMAEEHTQPFFLQFDLKKTFKHH